MVWSFYEQKIARKCIIKREFIIEFPFCYIRIFNLNLEIAVFQKYRKHVTI